MKLVVSELMSLDGIVQAPGGPDEDTSGGFAHGGWSMPYFDVEVMGGFVDEAMAEAEALLFGRRTWQTMAAHWPDRDDGSDPFASRMNEIPKHVVSSTLSEGDMTWANSTLIPGGQALEAVAKLREQPGGSLLVMGCSQLSRSLIVAGLVDELRLMLQPLLLGGGKTIHPADGELRPLELVGSTVASTGVICCVYRPSETPPMPEMGA